MENLVCYHYVPSLIGLSKDIMKKLVVTIQYVGFLVMLKEIRMRKFLYAHSACF